MKKSIKVKSHARRKPKPAKRRKGVAKRGIKAKLPKVKGIKQQRLF